ncbi:glutaminase A [Cellulomonas sp. S1-8]|uniref:glutaminase A n=1 Tax=Cellulomonas sp. S1-8 TaxID=2904790 RepID=UPI002242FD16|nr:glutaminase A [Cellulomonas sp. S1-8]UZN03912.1 glutaminase A [Cellulomonas sp. S1-8]
MHPVPVPQVASTGALPPWERVEELVQEAHAAYRDDDSGEVADYIPVLAHADPDLFGLCVCEVDGGMHVAGDVDHAFSVQSISKAFVLALVTQARGHDAVREQLGVDSTGQPFDSIVAVEQAGGHPRNAMVNAGALVATALVPGGSVDERWAAVHDGLSRFAGRRLELDEDVLASEMAGNQRNRAVAHLLASHGRLPQDPAEVVDVYTRQCSLLVTARDVAVMGATLADGGVNPLTGERVVAADVCRDTLAVLATAGMYEWSGRWLYEVGLPAKSGVAGGLVAVTPGKAGIGAFSPRLDGAGSTVRGQRAVAHLARSLGLNLFASDAHPSHRA